MGEVFLADQLGPHGPLRQVALKRMLPRLTGDSSAQRLFLDEMGTAAQLNHPNIAITYDFGAVDGVYFMAMEYVEGVTLDRLVAAHGPVSSAVAAAIAIGVLQALGLAHGRREPVVHQDVSPHNVMISIDGTVKLLDFGIAKAEAAVLGDAVRAKIAYASPEQLRAEPPDRRFDLWGLAVTLYEASTGVRPFNGTVDGVLAAAESDRRTPVTERRPEVGALGAVIDRALDPKRDARHPSAEAMLAAINAAVPSPAPASELAALSRATPTDAGKDLAEVSGTGVAAITRNDGTGVIVATTKPSPAPRPKPRRRWAPIAAGLAFGASIVVLFRVAGDRGASAPPTTDPIVESLPAPIATPSPSAELELAEPPPPAVVAAPAPVDAPEVKDRRRPRSPKREAPTAVAPPPIVESPKPDPAAKGGLGVLAVRATPWARVSLDGQPLGDGIIAGRPVTAGAHRVTLTPGDPKYAPKTIDIEVKPGGLTKIFADFERDTVRVQVP
jgi:eukaryotic-like serine/threonine-protein kinase